MPATRPGDAIAAAEADLAGAPPDTTDYAARLKAIRAVDALFPSVEAAKDPTIIAFYRRRVEAGLKALQEGPPAGHVRVVKFYSSSVVVTSRDGCFAFDFAEGPCGDTWRRPEQTRDAFRDFRLTDAQRDRLADLVRASFITHRHHDHVSYVLCERLAARRKPIVAPPETKAWFTRGRAPFADAITTPAPDTVHTLGPLTFVHHWGRQYMEWLDGDPDRPIKDSPKTVENNCYLVRLSGLTLGHCGDNREEAHVTWARAWAAKRWKPDVTFALGIGRFTADLSRLWGGRRISVHDYEFRHEQFNRLTNWLGRDPIQSLRTRPVLFWGEHLDIPNAAQ